MKVLYFDPIVGTSGDMILAALIDCGVPVAYLKRQLAFIPGCSLRARRVVKHGVSARSVRFNINKKIKEQHFIPLIKKSSLSAPVKTTATQILNRIFAVEKKVHSTDKVHLHELADADTLLDITGALVAIEYLNVDRIYTKPLKAGTGLIHTVEGRMPAFNFATAELLKGFPVDFYHIHAELTTPTGAAIISSIAKPAGTIALDKLVTIGMGCGSLDIDGYPNLLRVFIGETADLLQDECTVIQTNIDDMNPQDYDMVFEKLYQAGALEVFLTPTIMKNTRPGVLLTVLCSNDIHRITNALFANTTTLGLRIYNTKRVKLKRKTTVIKTRYGRIRMKLAWHNNKKFVSFEYKDLKNIAQKHSLSLKELRKELAGIADRA